MATFFIIVQGDDLNCTVINVGSNRAHFMTAENCEKYFQRDAIPDDILQVHLFD
jgi:hypothetical protein